MSASDDAADSGADRVPPMPRLGLRTGLSRRSKRILLTLLALIVLVVLVQIAADLWTTKLWFNSVGFGMVFRNEYLTKGVMFLVGGLFTGLLILASMLIAYRSRPLYAPVSDELDSMDRYRLVIEPFRRIALWVVPVFFGLFAGSAAAGQWQTALLWLNRRSFGVTDPEFHKDIGFYVFTMPWLELLIGFATMSLILSLVAAVVMHYMYGGISLQGRGVHTTKAARIHLCLVLAALVLVRALAYWLGRYELTSSGTSLITGIDYTAQNAVLPAKAVLAAAAVLCAALFVATIWTKTWRLPIIGTALLVVCAVILGGIYPAVVQRFHVKPNEQALQMPYLQRNISATRAAYGLSNVQVTQYTPTAATGSTDQLVQAASEDPGIRLVDPSVVSPTFRQLQGLKSYYQFADTLDVDRYTVGGVEQDTVLGVRELDLGGVPAAKRNWVNDHTVYTHGYGVVAIAANQSIGPSFNNDAKGFMESSIPPVGDLGSFQPRVYFSESSPNYSIVGGPANSQPRELDYPNTSTGGEQRTTYTGGGGVALGGLTRKLAYAVKYHDYNFLFSSSINADSRILNVRNPIDRVKAVAPWLTVDSDAYPVVEGGHIVWVVDGYTTTSKYPYSQLQSLGAATSDSLTAKSDNLQSLSGGAVNYIRNSVKATVDAYTGKVTLYAWDPSDPILKAWMSAFPGTVKPASDIPAALMPHLRYPEDLFKVQRELLTKYHVTDAGQFFQGNDQWQVPEDPTATSGAEQPPYYMSVQMPGASSPTYSLTTTYTPAGTRTNLAAFLAVDSDPGDTPGKIAAGYGSFQLLEMPRNSNVTGPAQFQNDVNTSAAISPTTHGTLAQFRASQTQGKSSVILGNLLTLPFDGGLLNVEPIYVQATNSASAYPQLGAVAVGYGGKFGWDTTLKGALTALFTDGTGSTSGSGSGSGSGGSGTGSGSSGGKNATVASALAAAEKWYNQAQTDLKKGDLGAYQNDVNQMNDAIKQAIAANGGTTPSGTPSASGSASASPSPSSTGK
ncbi:UPF0182 family protein [Rudaeicoccus suwonensis]|uniref:UPF0182 protein BKA23_3104 n=1 Tax=Rudaeicoccus suwonensis TaxID=657409 RepID=A0A561E1C6_9MICO|nr:UPF0182 family protein [Rudaeicoccus suwonensis]TWE09402.1 hypothetical protein BKA23_3104 [Rudaeicoccus suwonensis]